MFKRVEFNLGCIDDLYVRNRLGTIRKHFCFQSDGKWLCLNCDVDSLRLTIEISIPKKHRQRVTIYSYYGSVTAALGAAMCWNRNTFAEATATLNHRLVVRNCSIRPLNILRDVSERCAIRADFMNDSYFSDFLRGDHCSFICCEFSRDDVFLKALSIKVSAMFYSFFGLPKTVKTYKEV